MFDFIKDIDWNPILTIILQGLLSFLATALTSYFIILARAEWIKLQASQPDLVDKIQLAANWAFGVVEQLRKNNQLPSPTEAKEYAEMLVDKYLKAKGINVDLSVYEQIISAAIEKAINDNRNVVATTSVTTVESGPKIKFTPNVYSGYVNSDVNKDVPASVTTTTTNSVVSSDSVMVNPVNPVVPNVDGIVG